jgi:hypothetical protein
MLVEEYLIKSFLERRDYDTVLANSNVLQTFRIPDQAGQYCKCTRKNRFRIPETVDSANPTADPASGITMGGVTVKFPMEYIHEYVPISTIASWTSWIDLEEWAKEDMPVAMMRRFHQLTQNAAKVGRYTPGKWAADGTASTAFDVTAQTTPTIDGVSFTFEPLVAYFTGNKKQFAQVQPEDRHTMADYERARVRLALAGAPKDGKYYDAFISESVQSDLMKDDEYFSAVVRAFKGDGLREGVLGTYKGIRWHIDDEPFTEGFGAGGIRAVNGQIHTSILMGKGAMAYTKLGSKSTLKPTYKVQDTSITGKETTIGYTIPFQVAVANADFGCTITGPVSEFTPNNA